MLKELHLRHVGPAPSFDLEFGDRLSLLTGDNGLGKSFLLDVAWWCLTGTWADEPARPARAPGVVPEIRFRVANADGKGLDRAATFHFSTQSWPSPFGLHPNAADLVVYVRVDGGFSVWDTARSLTFETLDSPPGVVTEIPSDDGPPHRLITPSPSGFKAHRTPFHFTRDEVWKGRAADDQVVSNGLIRDWVYWQNQPDRGPFGMLEKVLEVLSHPSEPMRAGRPTRVSIRDAQDIPTLALPYGEVPVTLASAGMRRILAIAYLLVWTWYEHTRASELLNQPPADRLVLLIDEIEAHLHPGWQRAILPAIVNVAEALRGDMRTQVMATTHAPLVLASAEPIFDLNQDRLFLFQLEHGEVRLDEVPWAVHGDADGWLTSEVFGLEEPRSRPAEIAMEAADAFMRGDALDPYPAELQTEEGIHRKLMRLLPGQDPFLLNWLLHTRRI